MFSKKQGICVTHDNGDFSINIHYVSEILFSS